MRTALRSLMALVLVAGCQQTEAKTREYDVKGKVVAVEAGGRSITLEHEDIPGLMKAMTMKFEVGDNSVIEEVVVATDKVTGHLLVESGKYTLIRVKRQP